MAFFGSEEIIYRKFKSAHSWLQPKSKKVEPSLRKKNRNPQPAEINQAIKELIKK